jgi:hypothetical protein
MQITPRVLNVFLASPSDVEEERVAAEEVITDLDRIIGNTIGWNLRLHKWEDTAPAFGRPQAIINAAVDNCDLFIGLLWERWGQPTGDFSSGFEEEYERARSRRNGTDRPDIWLVFKTIEPGKLKDPGPQLARVQEFRQRITNEGSLLYRETKDLGDWKRKLRNWLDEYVFRLQTAATQPPQPPASSPQPRSLTASPQTEVTPERKGIPRQLLEATESLTKIVKSGDPEFWSEDARLPKEFDVAVYT